MTYEFAFGALAILGLFAIMVIVADYLLPALFPGLFDDNGE